ncbi:MAG TPA: acyl-CoA dehydrogenase family protein [Nevskiaceae bacterium]
MEEIDPEARFRTHEVTNQPPALEPWDAWATDLPLREALAREGAEWAAPRCAAYGRRVGGELMRAGRLANEHRPQLRAFDRYGHRIDAVEFHSAYHKLMAAAIEAGVTSLGWRETEHEAANVARMALFYLHNQADQGSACPLTMTCASVAALRRAAGPSAEWLPRVLATSYDPRPVPAQQKAGNTIGMGMTEKQGGSDVRANTTRAWPLEQPGGGRSYRIIGHKWFLSAPAADAHLVLAYTEDRLSCFLVPRFLPDGRHNAVAIERLKDKLGDWSNASAEVEFRNALGWLVGEEGRGIPTMLEMVALTRQDCVIGSAAIARQALVRAIHHARHRSAFGRPLIAQPLMKNVLADLALEAEAHLAFAAHLARVVGDAARDPARRALARVGTALGKYWVCKRVVAFVNEAQECLGGNGYIEESVLPRLYRQAPVNSIWEGSGNIQCLDLLRTLSRHPESRAPLVAELSAARGACRALDAEVASLGTALDAEVVTPEGQARRLAERIAVAWQAALLWQAGNDFVADAFCRSRLAGEGGAALGTLPAGVAFDALIDRAFPG